MSSLSPRLLPESEADEICLSNAFAPTIENWWESGATEWIKSYTLSNADNPRFKELGLIDHLAEVFLKKTNFKCGIDTPHRCAVECQEVVARVEDREDARVVWFVLKSAGHVAEVTKVVHVSSCPPDISHSVVEEFLDHRALSVSFEKDNQLKLPLISAFLQGTHRSVAKELLRRGRLYLHFPSHDLLSQLLTEKSGHPHCRANKHG